MKTEQLISSASELYKRVFSSYSCWWPAIAMYHVWPPSIQRGKDPVHHGLYLLPYLQTQVSFRHCYKIIFYTSVACMPWHSAPLQFYQKLLLTFKFPTCGSFFSPFLKYSSSLIFLSTFGFCTETRNIIKFPVLFLYILDPVSRQAVYLHGPA